MSHKTIVCPSVEEMEATAAAFVRAENAVYPKLRCRSVRVEVLTDSGFRPEVQVFKGWLLVRTFTV